MKVIEVQFEDYVKRPENQHNTQVLRLGRENAIGTNATVDSLVEDTIGITATKVLEKDGKRTTYTKRYPWGLINSVEYEPTVEAIKVEPIKVELKK